MRLGNFELDKPLFLGPMAGVTDWAFRTVCADLGADVLLTADAKYHNHQQAEQLGIALADAGHFETETIICPVLAEKLKQEFPDMIVKTSEFHRGFYRYF